MRNSCFCVGLVCVENVCGSSIGVDCDVRTKCVQLREILRTLSVHGHVQISNWAVSSEDFPEMVFIDIFGELLNDDLEILAVAL